MEARLGEAGLGQYPQYPQYHQYHQYHQYQAPRAVARWDSEDHFNLHWTVRATAFIATFFKVTIKPWSKIQLILKCNNSKNIST